MTSRSVDRRTLLRAGAGAAALAAGGLAGDTPRRRPGPSGLLRIATGEPTAFYAAFGRLLAAEITRECPRLRCRIRTTAGGITNIGLLRDGEVDLALVMTDTALAARGSALFPEPVPLRAIGRVYETYLQFAVRADSPVRAVSDLAGHPVSLGAVGSGAADLGERLLRAAGLAPGSDVPVRHLRLAEAAAAMREESVDGLLVAGGVPLPALSALDADPGLRFLPLAGLLPGLGPHAGTADGGDGGDGTATTGAGGDRAGSAVTGSQLTDMGLEQVLFPPRAYRAAGGVATVGVSNLLVCRPDLDPAVAGLLTRLLVLRAASLVPDRAVGAQFLDIRSLISTGATPLHPGAVTAYRALHG
ncbi:TAXI family TRAP transporter solute-binding subunit [Streptomyces abyssomicinicus]|uniref:TAXI family TRAP transporter solute-binding subunit n=1 Tax=Streptomyces abyssomicinicus TaxID=574929 RepID=UPI00124F974F|nr:TAXI family TRAP transporter solute-binding subunit [Streptomyces abyssomicinicus]